MKGSRADKRDAIVLAMLPHVPFDGWSRKSLLAGVADAGLSPDWALRAFPGGMAEVAQYFADYADRRMLAELAERDLDSLGVRQRIATALRVRFEINAPHRQAIRRMLSFLAMPHNAVTAAHMVYRTVDAIWHAAGDRSTDFNYYTKRVLLAAVYTATLLFWLDDRSEGFGETWAFLERRIADVMAVPKLTRRIGEALDRLPRPFRRGRHGA